MNNQEIDQAWSSVCLHARNYDDVSTGSFDAFAAKLHPQAMSSNYLMLTTDNAWTKEWIEKTYKQQIIRALEDLFGTVYTVDIEVDTTQAPQPARVYTAPEPAPSEKQAPAAAESANFAEQTRPAERADALVKSERFDNFVTGDSNILAYQLAVQVAAEPGKTKANPLFIYGRSGLGKTHLLRAIQNEILETIPGYNVKYTDTMDLVSKLSEASRQSSKDKESYKKFSQEYLDADVLLIDDVQYLATKPETLQNVFSFMNRFKSEGKQIVLSADCAPRNIEIEERYISRFSEGIIQDIGTPSVETKLSIIKNCLEEYREDTNSDFDLPQEVQEYIAEFSSSNIRELKGVISRITFNFVYSKQGWQTITKEQVEGILQDAFGSYRRITVADIQKRVADFYKVTVSDIISSKRSRPIAHARQVAIYLCQKMLGLTQSEIGKLFGNRDHSTIMYSETTVAAQIKEDWEFKEEIDLLTQMIREV